MDHHLPPFPTPRDPIQADSNIPPDGPYVPLSYADLRSTAGSQRDWLWQGYLFPGMIDNWHANFLADLTRRLADETPLS